MTDPSLEIDHVLVAVDDLERSVRAFEQRTGLTSVPGGRHRAWGTANRIVPLGGMYLELIAVVDPNLAASSTVGRWVTESAKDRPIGWVVRTTDLDAAAQRLGLQPTAGSRATADGRTLCWRTAGIEQSAAEPILPFYIEWGEGTPHPGGGRSPDRVGGVALERIELSGDDARLDAWLDGSRVPIVVEPGPPAVRAVVLDADGRELRI